eukprot:9190452-Lingulodinium_polyedra.AAC.1
MGWQWSFYFAQLVHASEVVRAVPELAGRMLEDRRPPPPITKEGLASLAYCDNLAGSGGSQPR